METNVYSHTFYLVWEPRRKLIAPFMLWSIDSCQNRVSADQYHLTVPRAQVSTHRGRDFFFIRWQITSLKWSQAQVYFFPMIHLKYVVFMSLWPRTIKILISNWPRTLKFSQFFKNTGVEVAGKTFSYHGHVLVTLYVQFLYSDWSKFDRWVHAKKLCSISINRKLFTLTAEAEDFCVNLWCF